MKLKTLQDDYNNLVDENEKTEKDLLKNKEKLTIKKDQIKKLKTEKKELKAQLEDSQKQLQDFQNFYHQKRQAFLRKMAMVNSYRGDRKDFLFNYLSETQKLLRTDPNKLVSDLQHKLLFERQKLDTIRNSYKDLVFDNEKLKETITSKDNEINRQKALLRLIKNLNTVG